MSDYKPPTESEWKTLATTEITHLSDEERERFPGDWDVWIAQIKRDAAREALDGLAEHESRLLASANLYQDKANHLFASQAAYRYRATHHPETEDQA